MLRRTKIVATMGPASDTEEVLKQMIANGLNVARLNFSHGSADEMEARCSRIRRVAAQADQQIAILGDLQGPKIRIRQFAEGRVTLENGQAFFLDPELDANSGTAEGVAIAYEALADDVSPGDVLLLDDGQVSLEVTGVSGQRVFTKVLNGGELSDRKGINKQGGGL
ncbi:MAG: pyruvate kinase, partial [Pseudomonadota bacterium]